MSGSGPLYDELHSHFEAAVEPTPLHRFLAEATRASPRSRCAAISSSSRRTTTSRSSVRSRMRGRSSTSWRTSPPARIEVASGTDHPASRRGRSTFRTRTRPSSSLERRTILLKLHGAVDPLPEREWESFVITEDDYIDYLGALGAHRGRPRRARREAAPEPLPVPRLRDGRLEPSPDPQSHLGRPPGRVSLVGSPARAERARAGVLATVRRRPLSTSIRRRTSSCSSVDWRLREQRAGLAVQGLNAFEDYRARRAPLLRARARDGDRRRQPHRLSAHRAVRAERRREVVAAACGGGALVPRALREEPLVVVFSSWSADPTLALVRGGG